MKNREKEIKWVFLLSHVDGSKEAVENACKQKTMMK